MLDIFLAKAVRRGTLTVHYPDGRCSTFGTPDATLRPVTIRFGDPGAIRAIIRNPSVGTPEMSMAGRLMVDDDDIIALLMVATANNRWERGGNALDATPLARLWGSVRYAAGRYNMARRSK